MCSLIDDFRAAEVSETGWYTLDIFSRDELAVCNTFPEKINKYSMIKWIRKVKG